MVKSATRRACSASSTSGVGPNARPVLTMTSSTAVSTTARARRAINSALAQSVPASTWLAVAISTASAAVRAASIAPRCACAWVSCGVAVFVAYRAVERCGDTPRCAQPACRHPDGPVPEARALQVLAGTATGVAAAPRNSTVLVSASFIPALRQLSSNAVTCGHRRSTAYRPRSPL